MLRAMKVTRVARVALLTMEEEVALRRCMWGVEERQVEQRQVEERQVGERQVGAGHV
jgi:hypothetical protein